MCQRTKRRFQKHRKFPNFYSTNQLNKGLLEKEITSQQRQSNNILEQFSDHLIFFFGITKNALISLALKVHSQNIYFTHGLMKLSTARCASPSRVRRAA